MNARAAIAGTQDAPRASPHPLTLFGFDALVAGAARPRPGGLAFMDDQDGVAQRVTYADLYQRVGAALSRFRDMRLRPGERVIICSPPGAQGFVTLTAALAAGLDPVLAPLPLPHCCGIIARAAKALEAVALFAPAQFCGLDFESAVLDLAAFTPSLRLIATLGGALEGASDFSAAALQERRAPRVRLSDEWSVEDSARLVGALDEFGGVDYASQGALLGAALDLMRATRAAGAAPILSLCAPSSLGALVAGPLMSLLAGAPLHSFAPFTSPRFLQKLASLGPVRLVAPVAVMGDLGRAGLLANGAVASVTAVSTGPAATQAIPAACPIVELSGAGGILGLRRLDLAPASVGAAEERALS